MSNIKAFLEACSDGILQDGLALRQTNSFLPLPVCTLTNGRIRLEAKVQDSFNFVDHPQVELDASGTTVAQFRCDCPDYRTSRRFCVHCAALVADQSVAPSFAPVVSTASMEEESIEHNGDAEEPWMLNESDLEEFSYRFCNSRWDLYPGIPNPRIPLERFYQIYGKNAAAETYFNMAKSWGGSCFGMVVSTSLLHQDDGGVWPADFRESAMIPSDLSLKDHCEKLDMTLHQFVEAAHILQYGACHKDRDMLYRLSTSQCIDKIVQQVLAFQRGETGPFEMAIYANSHFHGGHAILPYRLETVSDTEDRLHIYDPNAPMKTKYAYLEKDEEGQYLNWRFPMGSNDYSSKTDGKLSMTPYEAFKTAWDHRGGVSTRLVLQCSTGAALFDENNTLLAQVTAGGAESFREDIYPILITGAPNDFVPPLSLPAGAYTFRLADPSQSTLSVQLTGTDLSLTLNTEAQEASICINEEEMVALAQIPAPDCRYSIDILSTAGGDRVMTSLLDATAGEGLRLMQKYGLLYADGLTEGASLYINEKPVATGEHIAPLNRQEVLEEEPEFIVNTTDDKKPEVPQD